MSILFYIVNKRAISFSAYMKPLYTMDIVFTSSDEFISNITVYLIVCFPFAEQIVKFLYHVMYDLQPDMGDVGFHKQLFKQLILLLNGCISSLKQICI